ncbi:unnamed protein product, partial [Oppiella nova]
MVNHNWTACPLIIPDIIDDKRRTVPLFVIIFIETLAHKEITSADIQLNCQLKPLNMCFIHYQRIANEINAYTQLTVGPLVGTAYMPLTAQEAFKDGKYNTDVDLIAGVVHNEGQFWRHKSKAISLKSLDEVLAFYLKDVKKDDYAAYRWAYYDLI